MNLLEASSFHEKQLWILWASPMDSLCTMVQSNFQWHSLTFRQMKWQAVFVDKQKGWKISYICSFNVTEISLFPRLNFYHSEKPVCLHLVINIRVHYLIKILLRLPKVSESCGMTGIIKIFFFKWWNQLWTKDVFHSDKVFCCDPL